jgi:crotonobetainyl-CoA:carnitine CoA-transferase CaiB-like acyl-CoA transferase
MTAGASSERDSSERLETEIPPLRWDTPGCFDDLRVIEIGDEKGEFCGKLLAGDGAQVIKVEAPVPDAGWMASRRIGPFYEDVPDPERSLFFWHYNLGKRSVTLDLERPDGRRAFAALVRAADVLIDATPVGYLDRLSLGWGRWAHERPDLIMAAITPFGQTGPWKHFQACDLVHLALGGQMYRCGYDPVEWAAYYDTPPIAPQMWHAYHIAGEHAWLAIGAALLYRQATGAGQFIDAAIHDACAQCTEAAVADYIYNRHVYYRKTGAHASATPGQFSGSTQKRAGDGAYLNGGLTGGTADFPKLLGLLRASGLAEDLVGVELADERPDPGELAAILYALNQYVAGHRSDEAFHALQACGVAFAPVRPPEANLTDPHCLAREDFALVEHPEHGRSFVYPRHPRRSAETPWKCGPRAPLLGEHNRELLGDLLGLPGA